MTTPDIDVAAFRQRYKNRVEAGHDPRLGLYAEIQRDAVLGFTGVLPKEKTHRDADLSRKPDLSLIAADFLRMAGSHVPDTKAGKIEAGMKMMNGVKRSSYAVDDFPAWLGSTVQRAVTAGYDTAIETWHFLSSTKEVPDFRQFDIVTTPEFPSPAETAENGELPYMKLGSDNKESSALVSHSALFGLTRQALTNNDLIGLSTIPQALGRAANRAVGDKFYAVLAANAAMSDGHALFSSAHGNLVSSGAAPSVTAVGEARNLLTAQRGPSNSILNLRPALILGATVLEGSLCSIREQMAGANTDDNLTPGLVAGRLAVVTDARLDDADASAWYILCDPARHGGIGVYFLEGGTEPYVEQRNAWVSDAVDYKLMHDFAVLPVDFRTWVKNPGT